MKKKLAKYLSLMLFMTFLLSACGFINNDSGSMSIPMPNSNQAETPAQTTAPNSSSDIPNSSVSQEPNSTQSLEANSTQDQEVNLVQSQEQSSSKDYSKILNGDLSDFEGVWTNGNNETLILISNGAVAHGTVYEEFEEDGVIYRKIATDFKKQEDGCYTWSVNLEDYDGPNGFVVWFYPVGVEVYSYHELITTDTTKDRISTGHDQPNMANEVYYQN